MDITETLAPKSDQLDAVELAGGPRTFTVASVSAGNAEQPVQIHFADFPRPWRPSKNMRRVLAYYWGPQALEYVGRRVRLYLDPDVMFGKDKVGGTRIAALSHIDEGKEPLSLPVTRGKLVKYRVELLKERDWLTELAQTAGDVDAITALGSAAKSAGASDAVLVEIRAEYQRARNGAEK